MKPETSKNLGGIGAILMLIGIFPYVNYFGIIELIGLIMVMVALHGFSDYFKERAIFNYALYGVIVVIIGVILAVAIAALIVLPTINDFLMKIYPAWNGDWSTLPSISTMTPDPSAIDFTDIIPFFTVAIAVFLVSWITAIISAFFFRRSLMTMSAKSTVGLFGTAGLLLLIGAALIIVLVGFILIWIAILILAIAFLSIRPVQPMASTAASPQPV